MSDEKVKWSNLTKEEMIEHLRQLKIVIDEQVTAELDGEALGWRDFMRGAGIAIFLLSLPLAYGALVAVVAKAIRVWMTGG